MLTLAIVEVSVPAVPVGVTNVAVAEPVTVEGRSPEPVATTCAVSATEFNTWKNATPLENADAGKTI